MAEQTETIRVAERIPATRKQKDLSVPAQVLAVLVFLLGIGLLVTVFFWTWTFFNSLADANQQWIHRPDSADDNAGLNQYLPDLIALFFRVILLFVLGFVGSSIASKGAQLFLATRQRDISVSTKSTELP